jgi:hypothetical protein
LPAHHLALLLRRGYAQQARLIAANKSIEEIRRFIEADSLAYLSLDGLLKSVGGETQNGYCTACYTGQLPHAVGRRRRDTARFGILGEMAMMAIIVTSGNLPAISSN